MRPCVIDELTQLIDKLREWAIVLPGELKYISSTSESGKKKRNSFNRAERAAIAGLGTLRAKQSPQHRTYLFVNLLVQLAKKNSPKVVQTFTARQATQPVPCYLVSPNLRPCSFSLSSRNWVLVSCRQTNTQLFLYCDVTVCIESVVYPRSHT